MKGKWAAWGLVAVVLVLVVSGVRWRGREGWPAWLDGPHAADAGTQTRGIGVSSAPGVSLPTSRAAAKVGHPAEEAPATGAAGTYTLNSADPPTPELIAWLRRNGYPTEAELRRHANASVAQLPADGVARSTADVLAAEHAARDPLYRDRAIAVLKSAAANGSTYAMGAVARAEALAGDKVESEAYFNMAWALGDAAAVEAQARLPWQLDLRQQLAANMLAMRYLHDINAARSSRGLPPLRVDVRPDIEPAAEAAGTTRGGP